MPSEYPPVRMSATSARPTRSSTSRTRSSGMPFAFATAVSCFTAVRRGRNATSSPTAPTTRAGWLRRANGTPPIVAWPLVGRS